MVKESLAAGPGHSPWSILNLEMSSVESLGKAIMAEELIDRECCTSQGYSGHR